MSAELIAARFAAEILALRDYLELVDEEIEQRFFDRPEVEATVRLCAQPSQSLRCIERTCQSRMVQP